MESRLYACLGYKKSVKSTNSLTRYFNVYKISITLSSCQPSTLVLILKDNTTSYLNLSLDNFEENISSRTSNNSKKKIRLADINNYKKEIRLVNINKHRLATSN